MNDDFDEKSFWSKVSEYALRAGQEVIEKSLWLYYAAQAERTPKWAKSVIYGALAYFVLPIDAIPDLIPLAGFTDDLGALAAAVTAVAMYIDDDVRQKTRLKMAAWFRPDPEDQDPGF
jgi:uncharacterized membrane protein YkvA (DUF1232 family)